MGPTELCAARNAQELLTEFRLSGRQEPFEEIVRRYSGMVYHVCLRITRNAHDAEDATQAVFLTLAMQTRAENEIRCIGPWLQQVAHRVSLDLRKSRKRREFREEQHGELAKAIENGRSETDPLFQEELKDIITQELHQLPPKYRLPLILFYFGGLDRQTMARELRLRPGTLGVRLHRGREMLGQRLSQRGLVLSESVVGLALTEAIRSSITDSLIWSTSQAASQLAMGQDVGMLAPAQVVSIAKGAINAALLAKIKAAAITILLAGTALAAGTEVISKVRPLDLKINIPSIGDYLAPVMQPVFGQSYTEATPKPDEKSPEIPLSVPYVADTTWITWMPQTGLAFNEPSILGASPAAPMARIRSAPTVKIPSTRSMLAAGPAVSAPPAVRVEGVGPQRNAVPYRMEAPRPRANAVASAAAPPIQARPGIEIRSPKVEVAAGRPEGGRPLLRFGEAAGPIPIHSAVSGIGPWPPGVNPAPATASSTAIAGSHEPTDLRNVFAMGGGTVNPGGNGNTIPASNGASPPPQPTAVALYLAPAAPSSSGATPTGSIGTQFNDYRRNIVTATCGQVGAITLADALSVDSQMVTSYTSVFNWNLQPIAMPTTLVKHPEITGTTVSATGDTIRGWGKIGAADSFDQSGRVVADGQGMDRVLDLSDVRRIGNSFDNPRWLGRNGWFARNHGKLSLAKMATEKGTHTYTWGEEPTDPTLDLVNSVRLTLADVSRPAALEISLLSPDRNDVPGLPGGHPVIGLWQVSADGLEAGSMTFSARYDDLAAAELGLSESSLKLWRYDGAWQMVNDGFALNTIDHTIAGQAGSATYFAVSTPEPTGMLLMVGGALLLAKRSRRGRRG